MLLTGCGGKYMIKSFPADARLYIKDIRTNEKKLVGNTPTQITEDPKLGEVFFLVMEKENYKPKEIMVKINQGESLAVSARLDPLLPGDGGDQNLAQKKDPEKPQPGSPKKEDEPKDWQKEFEDIKLRIALLENTAVFTKEALFSPRLAGGMPSADRDRKETTISLVFEAQRAITAGKYDEALKHIDKSIQLDEYSTNSWLLKGSVKYLQKDFNGARIAWERTLKLDPYNKAAFRYLNSVYKILKVEPLQESAAEYRSPATTLEINRRQSRIPIPGSGAAAPRRGNK
ncbi:MAG: hypothetical protein JNL11_07650 [Bdellovibrionaceae bacterium]|nr:hypothetical protein [Pseudobdellovibrionaceae bacterium]